MEGNAVKKKITRKAKPKRSRAARSDTTIGRICASIEKAYKLPEGSVALTKPDGTRLRANAKIATLRTKWED